MSGIDEILGGCDGLQASQGPSTRICTSIPNCRTRSTAPLGASPTNCGALASRSPKDLDFETLFSFPDTDNDVATTARVAKAFAAHFGDNAAELPRQAVSEDFSKIPDAASVRTPTGASGPPTGRP